MALEEKTIVDMLCWRPELATIECRHASIILRDGMELSREYRRHVVGPKDDVSDEEDLVKRMAACFQAERDAAPSLPETRQ
jgi:hypothetical protein